MSSVFILVFMLRCSIVLVFTLRVEHSAIEAACLQFDTFLPLPGNLYPYHNHGSRCVDRTREGTV